MKPCLGLGLLLVIACSSGGELVPTSDASPTSTPTTTVLVVSTATSTGSTAPDTSSTTTALASLSGLTYTEIASGLPFPTNLSTRPADGALFFSTKDGQVWTLENGQPRSVMDISDLVVNRGEQGLLGMAWHPTDTSRLFLHYSDINGDTAIAEYTDLDSEQARLLLQIPQPAANHNGGTIDFGPDGYLWIALGDGGGGGDSFGTGQTTDDLLANILRLDVEAADPQPEVWSIGLRNPWRFSFDEDLVYVGDVGQNAFEEINVARSDVGGLNYGWPITEGLHCFEPAEDCDPTGITLPVLEVSHSDAGTCSITGGVVYRGVAIPELTGHYFYSDYCGGWLRSFLYDGTTSTEPQDWTEQVGTPGPIVSFGTDAAGEIYVLTDERILRIDPVR